MLSRERRPDKHDYCTKEPEGIPRQQNLRAAKPKIKCDPRMRPREPLHRIDLGLRIRGRTESLRYSLPPYAGSWGMVIVSRPGRFSSADRGWLIAPAFRVVSVCAAAIEQKKRPMEKAYAGCIGARLLQARKKQKSRVGGTQAAFAAIIRA